jgi:hypothetical protein
MARFKGIKWAQVLTLMTAIADTLETTFAKKSDLTAFTNPRFDGDTLVFPARNAAHFDGDDLVLTE